MGLPGETTMMLKLLVEDIKENPQYWKEQITSNLSKQGIEINLETVLGYICGLMIGNAHGIHITLEKRRFSESEHALIASFLKANAEDLRKVLDAALIE